MTDKRYLSTVKHIEYFPSTHNIWQKSINTWTVWHVGAAKETSSLLVLMTGSPPMRSPNSHCNLVSFSTKRTVERGSCLRAWFTFSLHLFCLLIHKYLSTSRITIRHPVEKQLSKQASFQPHQLPDLVHHATRKACARQGKGQNPNSGSNLHYFQLSMTMEMFPSL